jgi:hypothetical protein
MGRAGPVATTESSDRLELVSVVQQQIDTIYRELNLQVKRMGQLQVQVDELREQVKRLARVESGP